ncbi:MAG: ABC-type multidrug transport system, ATPase component [Chloroflexi bacterium AL-W]|nr:ABC-type multidrug transport system, ATPase component [Chloroflexi bacterium AL-N1]NOK64930.1 ABC-type multidrug transport system, ATPase component [Chloroflexi bacterium AL-N10]NOK76700.1 ABC-type multidrug transport system, ATPase component [Chloroflexi bacterium AL-N5]NOK84591.1 ABC-type multidrug transport system, ATPase component [Chloroflexi bacterium AL-W]NOK86584.1 ABC-type multidrug transport system, ATPase component [Chloroflexi bacterium AL-N15]
MEIQQHTAPVIEAIDLQKQYGETFAVKGVNLQVRPGEIFGFLGPNGAGKTTTIKMLIGLLRPTAGIARIGGHDMQREPIAAKQLLGFVPDQPYLPEKLSAREYISFIAGLYQVDRATAQRRGEEFLKLFGLEARGDELIGSYSHGMRQKTALTGALLHNPRAFFLDEPTVGLDPRSARLIKDILREIAERDTAVFMSTHILEIAERMCDRVAIISGGQIIAIGTMDELRAGRTSESLEDIFLELTGGSEEAEIADALV